MHSLGRQVTREQLLSNRQHAGAWFNLCVPVQCHAVKVAFDRFIAGKRAGEYKKWPGISGFGDDWARFLMMAWRGGYDAKNPSSHADYIGLTRISPYLLGPIEGFAKKDFGPPNQDSATHGIETSTSVQRWDCTREMAKRLIELEKAKPGSVRMAPNIMLTAAVAGRLKAMGFSKPFLGSKQQFIYDTILTYRNALEAVLPFCMLSGPLDSDLLHLCWFGDCSFAGRLGSLKVGDFTGEVTSKIALIINIEPLITKLDGLLEPPRAV
jgi:hypothetical protein